MLREHRAHATPILAPWNRHALIHGRTGQKAIGTRIAQMTSRFLTLGAASLAFLAATSAPAASTGDAATFTVLVSNVSTETTLRLPGGGTSRVPVAPGAYAVIADGATTFEAGAAAGDALERLAEDGNPDAFVARLRALPGVRQAGRFLHDEPFDVSAHPGERLVFF